MPPWQKTRQASPSHYFNFIFYSITGIRPDIQDVDQVAENHKVQNVSYEFSKQYFELGTK